MKLPKNTNPFQSSKFNDLAKYATLPKEKNPRQICAAETWKGYYRLYTASINHDILQVLLIGAH